MNQLVYLQRENHRAMTNSNIFFTRSSLGIPPGKEFGKEWFGEFYSDMCVTMVPGSKILVTCTQDEEYKTRGSEDKSSPNGGPWPGGCSAFSQGAGRVQAI